MDDHLLGWLKTLDEERLTRVLANRPDAIAPPWPRRLDTLAQRLGSGFAAREAMRGLPLPALEVAQAALALGGRVDLEELAGFLDASEAEVARWVEPLFDRVLAWPDDKGLIRIADGAARWWTTPCGLGEPLTHYLNSWTVSADALRALAGTLGLSRGPKDRTVAEITELLSDPGRLNALIERAPAGTERLLREFAWEGPVRDVDGGRFVLPGSPEKWAGDHGLLFRPSWNTAEMPREVALALRGPGYHPPFTPAPPDPATVPVDPEAVDHLMTLTVPHMVERCAAMLEHTAKVPLPLLKAGGVGVREVRRLARETGCDEDETRLLLEICAVARLLAWDDRAGGLVPTEKFDRWRLDDAAARLRVLLSAWWRMERSSLRRVNGKYGAVLGDDPAGPSVAHARRAVLGVLARLPDSTACTDLNDLIESTHWHAPLLDRPLLDECVPAMLDEARMLGLLAYDTITDLGRALAALEIAGDENDESVPLVESDPALVECSIRALAGVRRSALFGADLTAVVTGPPSTELAELLDRAAERESRGTASVWRFTPASVRGALDAGRTADELLADLAEVGTVPQPLEYLVRDVARRHGEVTVTTAACIVQASDPILLAEIAGHRRLSGLGLRLLAPTVLVSALPADRTLAALRESGYAPVAVEDSQEVTVRRARIEEPRGDGRLILLPGGRVAELEQPSCPPPEPPPDPREHARRLLASEGETSRRTGRTWAIIGRMTSRLPTAQQSLLGFVVDRGVRAAITLADGVTATISHGELRGGLLDAWCEEAGDYLEFPLADIVEVRGAYA